MTYLMTLCMRCCGYGCRTPEGKVHTAKGSPDSLRLTPCPDCNETGAVRKGHIYDPALLEQPIAEPIYINAHK